MKVLGVFCLLSATVCGLNNEALQSYREYADQEIERFRNRFIEYQYQMKPCCMWRAKAKALIAEKAEIFSDALSRLSYAVLMTESQAKYEIIDQKISEIKQMWEPHVRNGILSIQSLLNPSVVTEYDVAGSTGRHQLAVVVEWDHPVIKKYVDESWRDGVPVGANW